MYSTIFVNSTNAYKFFQFKTTFPSQCSQRKHKISTLFKSVQFLSLLLDGKRDSFQKQFINTALLQFDDISASKARGRRALRRKINIYFSLPSSISRFHFNCLFTIYNINILLVTYQHYRVSFVYVLFQTMLTESHSVLRHKIQLNFSYTFTCIDMYCCYFVSRSCGVILYSLRFFD